MALTVKQEAFVREYLIDLNATQAAIRAGYSAKTAMEQGYQLLQKTSVAAAIAEVQSERAEKCAVDATWVLREAMSTYKAARDLEKLSEAVSALKLVGTHIDIQAFKERTVNEHTGKDGEAIRIEQDASAFESAIASIAARNRAANAASDA
jgi:phage terminase small subunit